MEEMKPKIPREAVELYDLYMHGGMPRRDFLEGLKKFAVGGLALPVLVEALMPNYALGQVVSKTDDRIKAEYATVPSPQGNGTIRGYLVKPSSAAAAAKLGRKIGCNYLKLLDRIRIRTKRSKI